VGDSTDVQFVENADSVRVYLYRGSTLKDSTRTTSGEYHFGGLRGGPFSVVTVLWGNIGATVEIASVTADMTADPLVLESSPTMIGFPNPFPNATAVQFPVYLSSAVELIARKPSGLTVRSLVQTNLPAGYHQVTWDAKDDSGALVPAGPYWILYRAGSDYRCRLVWIEVSAHDQPAEGGPVVKKKMTPGQLSRQLGIPKSRGLEAVLKAQLIAAIVHEVGRQGMTHGELSERSGLPRSAVTGILSGSLQKVTIDRLLRLLEAAGLEANLKVRRVA
jgi:predicted XRE-type DNA-binding protein